MNKRVIALILIICFCLKLQELNIKTIAWWQQQPIQAPDNSTIENAYVSYYGHSLLHRNLLFFYLAGVIHVSLFKYI